MQVGIRQGRDVYGPHDDNSEAKRSSDIFASLKGDVEVGHQDPKQINPSRRDLGTQRIGLPTGFVTAYSYGCGGRYAGHKSTLHLPE